MAKIFILPREIEIERLAVCKGNADPVSCDNLTVLCPDGIVISIGGRCDKIKTAENIAKKIKTMVNDHDESYLLYHIGSSIELDKEFAEIFPELTSCRYSRSDNSADNSAHKDKHQRILKLIENIINNNVSQNTESIIKEFFYDKVLEAKLALLHDCLVPSGIPDLITPELENAKDAEVYQNEFQKFKDAWKKDTDEEIFNPAFIEALAQLRNTLLGASLSC